MSNVLVETFEDAEKFYVNCGVLLLRQSTGGSVKDNVYFVVVVRGCIQLMY